MKKSSSPRRRSSRSSNKPMPACQYPRADVLLVEEQVRQHQASDLKRVKELEVDNARLKRMYVELAMDNAAIKVHPAGQA